MELKFRTIRRFVNIAIIAGLVVFAKTVFAQDGGAEVVSAVYTVWVGTGYRRPEGEFFMYDDVRS